MRYEIPAWLCDLLRVELEVGEAVITDSVSVFTQDEGNRP